MLNEFDHRSIGASYDLFSFFEEGPGFPVWHARGLRIKNALIQYWREVHLDYGYEEIQSPMLLDKSLWKKSGHCDYFEENMFFSSVEKRDYAIKPMSCPGAILLFQQKRRSHRELPMRLCELGHVHRNENSGSLHGLMRVRSFVQDDAHIFCREEDLLSEIKLVIELIEKMMEKCGLFEFHFELSIRGGNKKFLGKDQDWDFAEAQLEQGLVHAGYPVIKKEGEAKFYGPSLDLHLKDVHGRFWQCSSLQLDFNLPSRFELSFLNEKGEKKVPFMLHRAIFGSLERFIGILLENYGKNLPLWMHPHPYQILVLHEGAKHWAQEIYRVLRKAGIFADIKMVEKNLKDEVKKAHEDMVHSFIIVGLKEAEEKIVNVKNLSSGEIKKMSLEKFGGH
jgi:threonyl-tRNA synthetase